MFLFHLHHIPTNVVSLQSFEVMRPLGIDSTNVHFCAFIFKLALEMFMLHCFGPEETGVFVCLRPRDFTLQMWTSFFISSPPLAFCLSSLLLGSWGFVRRLSEGFLLGGLWSNLFILENTPLLKLKCEQALDNFYSWSKKFTVELVFCHTKR